MISRPRPARGSLVLLVPAVLGALVVLLATRHGIGLSTDSVAYIDGARNLARGDGFTGSYTGHVAPITHWPPLYAALLAGIALLGIDPLVGARAVATLLFGANVFVAGWLVRRHGADGRLPPMASAFLVLVSADLLEVHSWGWSEPLFLFFVALGIHHLAVYLGGRPSRRRLTAAATLVGLAAATRYVGVTVILAGGMTVLWLAPGGRRRRVADAALFGAVSTAPLALWMLRNRLVDGSATDRALVVNPLGPEHLIAAARTVSAWLVPALVPGRIRLLLLVGALAAVGIGAARQPAVARTVLRSPGGTLLKTLLSVCIVYGGFLALTIALLDADVTPDARILSPIHFLLVIALGLVLAGIREVRWRLWTGLATVVLLQAAYTAVRVRAAAEGLGYAGQSWRGAALWRALAQLPEQASLHSNAYDAIYIHTGRVTQPLPTKFNPNSLVPDDRYRDRIASLRAELARNGGVVVYVPMGAWRPYMPTEVELQQGLAPYESRRFPGGTLYRVSR